jgi:arsenate reductase
VTRAGFTESLARWLGERAGEEGEIPDSRRLELDHLAAAVGERIGATGGADLVFVCTHNSRRSQLAQIWAQVAAAWHGVAGVRSFSGGTEATAFDQRARAAVARAGAVVEVAPDGTNPMVTVSGWPGAPLHCWSKRFQDDANPGSGHLAVMTCGSADEACPVVPGAAARIALRYVDPKVADGTPEESQTYDARSREIARDLLYAFSLAAASARG